MKDTGKMVYWHLNRENMTASPELPGTHMKTYAVPLRRAFDARQRRP